ncbi:MAG: hypothetical protein WC943_03205 [Elusimicrobiota bacterium]|jgi:hypothetical protein
MSDSTHRKSPQPDPTLAYLDDAEEFALAVRSTWPFRYLRWFLRCSEDELDLVIAKIYCTSLPVNWTGREGPARTITASIFHPIHILLTKSLFWRPSAPATFDLETIDPVYFNRFFAGIHDWLNGTRRISPRHGSAGFSRPDVSESIHGTVSLRSALLLFLAPICIPRLLALAPRGRALPFLQSFRRTLSVYAQFEGHFRRYPCRHFVTFSDEENHPSRWLAFKQFCPGSLVAVQNAERCGARMADPVFAFGVVDLHLTFGSYMLDVWTTMRGVVTRILTVGSLGLNEFHGPITTALSTPPAIAHDILVPDQGVRPHNQMPEVFHLAVGKLLGHLHRLKSERPGLRIAYQLRHYPAGWETHRNAVVSWLESRYPGTFEILDNPTDRGESYFSILKSELVVTFASTMGFEALRLGRKALFVNYSGDPTRTICADPRYQIDDPQGNYPEFVSRIDDLLTLRLDGPPEIALIRHSFFDGRVQDRIAEALNRLEAGAS